MTQGRSPMGRAIKSMATGVGLAVALALAAAPLHAQTAPAPDGKSVLELLDMPSEASVFINGSLKGKGLSRVEVILPGVYEVVVRRPGFRPWKRNVSLESGTTVQARPEFVQLRLAIFPVRRVGNWGSGDSESSVAVWVTNALASAARAAGFEVTHSVHVSAGYNRSAIGEDLAKSPDIQQARGFTGSPAMPFAAKKGQDLDVDAVLYFTISTSTNVAGFWQAQVLDPKTRAVIEETGNWPYGRGAGPAVTRGMVPVLERLTKQLNKGTGLQTVAVLEFEAENADPGSAVEVSEALRQELRKIDRYSVMDSSEVAAILDRLVPNRTICTAVECALEVGKLLGAQKVISGRVTGLSPEVFRISVIQVDVATGETLSSESVRHKGSLSGVNRTLTPVANELAVSASPDGQEFRSSQTSWRWKTGLAVGGAVAFALAGSYFASEVISSNERQKDYRTKAETFAAIGSQVEYDKAVKKLKAEQTTGKGYRDQAIAAQVIAGGLAAYAVWAYFTPPELPPVALNIGPTVPERGGFGLALSYSW